VVVYVDDLCLKEAGLPGFVDVVEMNMAVEEVSGTKSPEKPEEDGETLVARVLPVLNPPRGGMSEKDVQIASVAQPVPEQTGSQPEYPEEHLPVGELMQAVIVDLASTVDPK